MTHPYLTSSLPGIGGTIKESADDFLVEEIPSYTPCGSGEHCYLTIEKRGITTLEAISRIARSLKVPERDFGYAGMKDAIGVTRQTLSIQWLAVDKALALQLDDLRILAAVRHTNKLKTGHLKGNRFRIVIRGVSTDAARQLPAILDILAKRGVHLNLMRVRGFPFAAEVDAFVEAHDKVFVVEQNRDAQLRTLLINEGDHTPKKLGRVLHYDGSPITARFIVDTIAAQI